VKEKRFNEILQSIKPDSAMDQRIINRISNYESSNTENNLSDKLVWMFSHKVVHSNVFKTAAAFVMLIILGTTTALAASYIIKSYTVKEYNVIPEPDYSKALDRTITSYGEGHKNVTVYQDGKLIEKPEDTNKEDVKYGDEVFALLGLPNLVPTYLYEHYLLEEGGYKYIEGKCSDGSKYKQISAGFYCLGATKYVFIDFIPSEDSMKDTEITFANNDLLKEDLKISTYTTPGGLICNLSEDDNSDLITAHVIFDSEVLGNAEYLLSFTHIDMEEVKKILGSIPITTITE
jgi:hypothetical protein